MRHLAFSAALARGFPPAGLGAKVEAQNDVSGPSGVASVSLWREYGHSGRLADDCWEACQPEQVFRHFLSGANPFRGETNRCQSDQAAGATALSPSALHGGP